MQKSKKALYTIIGASAFWGITAIATTVVVVQNFKKDNQVLIKNKVEVVQVPFSSSNEVKLEIKNLSSEFINNELTISYWEDRENAFKKSKVLTLNNSSLQFTLGGLNGGSIYKYLLQSGNSILSQGTISTQVKPILERRGSTDKDISFVISNLGKEYLASTLTVRYSLADSPDKIVSEIDVPVSDNNRQTGTDFYQVLGKISSGIEKGKKYIITVSKKNVAGVLTLPLVVETKDVPTFELVKAYSYSIDFKINKIKSYIESSSKETQFLVKYRKKLDPATTRSAELGLELGESDPLSFSIKNLEPATEYEIEVQMLEGSVSRQISGKLEVTTTGAVSTSSPEVTFSSLTSAKFENLNNFGEIDNLVFVWVRKPASGQQPLFLPNNLIAISKDTTVETTGVITANDNVLNDLEPGTTYVGQIFTNNDKSFSKPLLKMNYEFSTLKNLSFALVDNKLKIKNLEQLNSKELTFVFTEVPVAKPVTSSSDDASVPTAPVSETTPISQDYTVTSVGEQEIEMPTSLTVGKKYEVKIYLKSDTTKANLLFKPFVFEKPVPKS